MTRYLDPTTDFGFKKLFGEEANKDIISSFITDVLELNTPLTDIHFLDKEQLPSSEEERTGIYDIYCTDAERNHFIVELQKSRLAYVRDRMLYYATFPIAAQAKKGGNILSYFDAGLKADRVKDTNVVTAERKPIRTSWDYHLDSVYCIAILGYCLNGSTRAVNRNSLRNDEPPHELFYDRLRFVTIELPLFDEDQPEYCLDNRLKKWLYFFKTLPTFSKIPEIFAGDVVFEKAFRVAELAKLSPRERYAYHLNLKRIWDSYAALETSYNDGMQKGIQKGMQKGMQEGLTRGRIQGKIEDLVFLLTQKFGSIPVEIEKEIRSIDDIAQINAILSHIFELNDPETLKKFLSR